MYLNEIDQFVKHTLRLKHYLRYTDDFIVLHPDRRVLEQLIPPIEQFLGQTLRLALHPRKVELRKLTHGLDFLGYVVLPHHRVLRTRTKRRLLRRVTPANWASYEGLLAHCNGFRLAQQLVSLVEDSSEGGFKEFADFL